MSLRDRFGIDFGNKIAVEEALAFAARNGVRYVDVRIDVAPNALESFDERRCSALRDAAHAAGVALGLHSLSAVNIAETSPFVRDAADRYLEGYIDVAKRLGAAWVDVHAGYHFSSDYDVRRNASLERLKRAVAYAEKQNVLLLLENLNREPEHAEVHYLGSTIDEMRFYFGAIDSPHLKWAFTVNHANLEPEGIAGFIDALSLARCHEVRLADNTGEYEIHLLPGKGTIDFTAAFRKIEEAGFDGHYMLAFGRPDDMLAGRDYLIDAAARAGVR